MSFDLNHKHLPSFVILTNCLLLITCSLIVFNGPSAEKLYNHKNMKWQTKTTSHFKLYFEAETYAHKNLSVLKKGVEKLYSHILSLLGEKAYNDTIHIFIVDSRKTMKDLLGWETNGSAFPKQNVACYVYSKAVKAATSHHEITHIISINLWGNSQTWIKEGVAVYSDNCWHGYSLHGLCKYLMKKHTLVPLKSLMTKFNSYNDLITYPQAGSFVKFLYENYGLETVKRIWKKGGHSIPAIIGKDLETLEQEWHNILNKNELTNIKYEL
ncbi:MAG: peptidase MA family metallohydrolase [bacterium]